MENVIETFEHDLEETELEKHEIRKSKMNRAKTWQIGLFAFNNTATNFYMFLMAFVSYYATGIVGLGVVLVGSVLMAMRIFDGITDPFIGFIVDRTDGKFGKNRPFMIIGNVILASSTYILFHYSDHFAQNLRLPFFIFMYAIFIIGYTFQCVVTKSAQSCLTNDPSQRPIFAIFDGVYNTVLLLQLQFQKY